MPDQRALGAAVTARFSIDVPEALPEALSRPPSRAATSSCWKGYAIHCRGGPSRRRQVMLLELAAPVLEANSAS